MPLNKETKPDKNVFVLQSEKCEDELIKDNSSEEEVPVGQRLTCRIATS